MKTLCLFVCTNNFLFPYYYLHNASEKHQFQIFCFRITGLKLLNEKQKVRQPYSDGIFAQSPLTFSHILYPVIILPVCIFCIKLAKHQSHPNLFNLASRHVYVSVSYLLFVCYSTFYPPPDQGIPKFMCNMSIPSK